MNPAVTRTYLGVSHCCRCYLALLLLFVVVPGMRAQQVYQPIGDSRSTVVSDHARFTVLTSRMIRMEWAEDGRFEDRPSLVVLNRLLPVPAFKQFEDGDSLVIRTSQLELRYRKGSGKFTAENLSIHFSLLGEAKQWHVGLAPENNLMGTARTLDQVRGDNVKLETGLVSRDGWSVIDDSTSPLFDSDDFSFRQGEESTWPWVVERTPSDRQDLYFLGYGHAYREALHDYTQIAGKIPLPPRFAFGAWWSRYWDYSDAELKDLVQQFHEHKVPLDVLVIDMGWHLSPDEIPLKAEQDYSGHTIGWSGYTWNPKYFPHPESFLAWVHQQGLKATLNLHPASGVQPWEKPFPEMAKAMGIDPATQKYVPFDLTNKKFATNYMNLLHHPLEKQGIDFWWIDWQQEMKTRLATVNPTWWLNYVHFTDQEREGKRPLIFHRWGGLGNHRYQIGFSGDTVSVWESLAFQPYFTATAANVGYSYWSHDIGGHMPGKVDAELYTRWIQFGIFSPILRTHTTKNPEAERRIWAYPEPYSDVMRSAYLLRYSMQPYIYTEARKTYDTGVAFLHPLYYDYPEVAEAYSHREEYKFGDNIVVSPIVQPADAQTNLSSKDIWLPEGEWIEWQTGRHLTGPGNFHREFTISQIPVYIKSGTILPMQPEMDYTGERPVDPLILEILPFAPSQQSSSYSVYEDSGKAEDYTRGEFVWTPIEIKRKGTDGYQIKIEKAHGGYTGMPDSRRFELHMDGVVSPSLVAVNGRKLSQDQSSLEHAVGVQWSYDVASHRLVIQLASQSVRNDVEIQVLAATYK